MLDWADIIQPLEVTDVPPALQDLPTFADPRIETMRFSARGAPPTTLPLEPAPVQPWPLDNEGRRYRPLSMRDLLEPEAIVEVQAWVEDAVADLLEMEENGSVERRRCARVLALGPDSFLPFARGTYWDLRDFLEGSGPIKPLDLNEVKESHLNLPYFAEQLADYPDQELLSFLPGGVSFKADLPYQLVLMPHLISLPPGIASVQSEIRRLSEQGCYGIFRHFALLPCRLLPQGAVPRKLEERMRRTTNASAPHREVWDSSGQLVVPNNVASKGAHRPRIPSKRAPLESLSAAEASEQPEWYTDAAKLEQTGAMSSASPTEPDTVAKWPAEDKPRLSGVMNDLLILGQIARRTHQTVYTFTDDFKDFLHGTPSATEV